jgi:hypothetical protein
VVKVRAVSGEITSHCDLRFNHCMPVNEKLKVFFLLLLMIILIGFSCSPAFGDSEYLTVQSDQVLYFQPMKDERFELSWAMNPSMPSVDFTIPQGTYSDYYNLV